MEAKYVGLFVDREKLLELADKVQDERLYRIIDWPHVTIKYAPDADYSHLYGVRAGIRIVGYGNNGRNEAFKVEVFCDNPEICDLMAKREEVLHITISVAKGSKPYASNELVFKDCSFTQSDDNSFDIDGVFGGMDADRNVYLSKPVV